MPTHTMHATRPLKRAPFGRMGGRVTDESVRAATLAGDDSLLRAPRVPIAAPLLQPASRFPEGYKGSVFDPSRRVDDGTPEQFAACASRPRHTAQAVLDLKGRIYQQHRQSAFDKAQASRARVLKEAWQDIALDAAFRDPHATPDDTCFWRQLHSMEREAGLPMTPMPPSKRDLPPAPPRAKEPVQGTAPVLHNVQGKGVGVTPPTYSGLTRGPTLMKAKAYNAERAVLTPVIEMELMSARLTPKLGLDAKSFARSFEMYMGRPPLSQEDVRAMQPVPLCGPGYKLPPSRFKSCLGTGSKWQ